jgi:serine/threonine-protein kinase
VLYEMLTGKRAFEGDDIADTLANVLKVEPDWNRLPSSLPPAINVLLRRCFAKDARQRCGDMAAALILLEESAHLTPGGALLATAQRTPGVVQRFALPATVAVVLAAGVAAATWWAMRPSAPAIVRTSIVLPGSTVTPNEVAITPDGTHIVYTRNNQSQLVVRALDELEPKPLTAGSNIRGLSASPDGQSVVYTDGDMLMKVALSGGAPVPITRVDAPARGTTWLDDDTIVFATANAATGLQRVAASGGDVTVLTKPDPRRGEGDHIAPTGLPGGRAVLFTITSNGGALPQIAVMDIETGERKIIARGTQGRYVASGHLVYTVDGVLQAVPFDLDTRMMRGTPVPVLQQFRMVGGLIPVLDVAATGTLVYGLGSAMSRVPVWVDREGHETAIKGPTSMYQTPRLSPDGRRLAYFDITSTGEYDVWILDLERGTADRLTTDPGRDSEPIWSPDSTRIAYLSGGQAGGPGVFVRRADGAGTVERLTNGVHLPMHWSADGKWLAYADFRDQGISIATVSGIMKVQIDGDHTPQVLLKGSNGRISPTERWVAVTSSTTGTDEVYVLPFPETSRARTRISTDGGQNPTWAPDGKTLYYRRGQAVMAVSVGGDDPSTWPKPTMLFEGPYVFDVGPTQYDAARDGRLLMVKPVDAEGDGASRQLVLVQNWFEELRRLAPLK